MITWRKRQNFLAHRWGTLNFREEETTRPQHRGIYKKCDITGEWIIHYPSWKRWVKYCVSVPLTVAFTFVSSVGILIVYANRDIVLAQYFGEIDANGSTAHPIWSIDAIGEKNPISSVQLDPEHLRDPKFWYITAGFPAMIGLVLPILNFVLMRISVLLNDFENYRTETHYRNALIAKVFAFRFVAYF